MQVLVLNGSPKGELSVTLQYVRFIEKRFRAHSFKFLHVGKRIKQLAQDPAAFAEALADVMTADLVLWATPVYYWLVPSQLKQFIELVNERGEAGAFSGRYAAAVTTSIHFYDHTAHNYLAGICEDWGMRYYGGHSAEMMDLLSPRGQKQLQDFAQGLLAAVETGAPTPVTHAEVIRHQWTYTPGTAAAPLDQGDRRVLVLADGADDSPNLARMVARIVARFQHPVDVANLSKLDIKAGCQGCLQVIVRSLGWKGERRTLGAGGDHAYPRSSAQGGTRAL